MVWRIILSILFINIAIVVVSLLLLPSPSTLDLAFEADVVEFELGGNSDQIESLKLDSALFCGDIDVLADNKHQNSPPCGAREDLSWIKNARLDVSPPARVVVRRPNYRELELSIKAMDISAPIRIRSPGKETTVNSVFVRLSRQFFDEGNVFSLGTLVSRLVVGTDGRTFGETNGLLLLKGSATPIQISFLSSSTVAGKTFALDMGDIVDYEPGPSPAYGNLFIRVSSDGTITGTGRIPIKTLNVRRLGGAGTPVFISWWDRILMEPTLVALWAMIGFLSAALGTVGGLVWKRRSEIAVVDSNKAARGSEE